MPLDFSRARPLLHNCELAKLFIEELGWEPSRQKLTLRMGEKDHALAAIAEKHGFTAWLCQSPDGHLPDRAIRLKLDRALAETSFEHLIVFTDKDHSRQSWMWVRREPGRPLSGRTHEYTRGQPGDSLLQKLQLLFVSLEEEEAGLSVMEISGRVRVAFDVERVTKKFYKDFDAHRKAFLKFIEGVSELADREWYASVMLNRLMFVYFIQRKGFLDGAPHYLRNRLSRCQQEKGKDKFYSFYRYFLLRLFHEGLGGRKRTPDLEKLLGKIPYLNGGMFERHAIEERYDQIQIPDRAFERIFDYFDQYQWHLDERPLRADNEINPDVLGYIFEKYINQKQMGAYYTKEDITEYISKNTVIPFLLDTARAKCKVAFENPAGPTVWDLLAADPDRYIYPAVRHGVDQSLPPEVAKGLDTTTPALIERREGWNRPAPGECALPTEIWREVVARRKRCEEIRTKLATGEVREVNDLITLNLDIRQFAQDVVEKCEGPDLLRACWNAIERVTILDPTCGSGAFLFAALNILEPLYEACLDRMEAFLEDEAAKLDRVGLKHTQHGYPLLPHKKFEDFALLLERVAAHPNRRYFIFKSIILNNLFGVDLMEEAVEICKLRLFLKLAAQVEPDAQRENLGIEPLPDIDFNIRAGNTLVGFASQAELKAVAAGDWILEEEVKQALEAVKDVASLYECFLKAQVNDDESPAEFKRKLNEKFPDVRSKSDGFLAETYELGLSKKSKKLAAWKDSHQPFHWFVEFYWIMESGGFDVIIGNPPYVEYNKVRADYTVQPIYTTQPCGNLYTLILERCYSLARKKGWVSFIVPLSLVCTSRTDELREIVKGFTTWISNFDMRPGCIFEGVAQRLSIFVSHNRQNDTDQLFTGGYRRWAAEERPHLIQQTAYAPIPMPKGAGPIPKFCLPVEQNILAKIAGKPLAYFTSEASSNPIFVHRIVRYFVKALNFTPLFVDARGKRGKSEDYKEFGFASGEQEQIAALLNSTLFYWFWRSHCDGFHCGYSDVYSMPYRPVADPACRQALKRHLAKLMRHLQDNSENRTITTKAGQIRYQEFYLAAAKPILDEIDHTLAQHYGFTEEELDFIINYDTKYRMGRDAGEEET